MDDDRLMLLVAQGDEGGREAFARLHEKWRQQVLAFIPPRTGNRQAAEELTEEVFRRVWAARPTYQPKGRFRSWLLEIARNVARDHLRASRAVKRRNGISGLDTPSFPSSGDKPDETAEMKEGRVRQFQHLGLLTEALDQSLRWLPPDQVSLWRLAAIKDRPKAQLAAEEGVARQNLHETEAKIEAFAAAGMLVNAFRLAEPGEAADALLSDFTLASPGRLADFQVGERSYSRDHRLGLAYYSAENTRALDRVCGFASKVGAGCGAFVSVQDALKITLGFEELMQRAANHLATVLADSRRAATPQGTHSLIRDCSFMFYAARVLGEEGRAAVRQVVERLSEAGVSKNIHLQREMAIIQAYTGTSGSLSQWYQRVGRSGYERNVDTALLITYLAGPRHRECFPEAVAWGRQSDIEEVLGWAKSNWRTVAARWMSYINYCMDNPLYQATPDLGEMVASWAAQLITGVPVNDRFRAKLQAAVERFLDRCEDRNLRIAVEKTLKTVKGSR